MRAISQCRICQGKSFKPVLELGWQSLTGIFPKEINLTNFPGGFLNLVRCSDDGGCGLVQLDRSFDPNLMYGANYGYRSGLNRSMVEHLRKRVASLSKVLDLKAGDVVIDIGSNDGTTLSFYDSNLTRIGIDPTAQKFQSFYSPEIIVVSDFFSSKVALTATRGKLASAITSISMIYDLEDPVQFFKEVGSVLAQDGVWVFEQSYMPLMLERTAFDTICHEHIEYYALRQIDLLLELAGLEAIDVETNDINGGSFAVSAAHRGEREVSPSVFAMRERESQMYLNSEAKFLEFEASSKIAISNLREFIVRASSEGKRIAGLGASTKGNVLLQFADLSSGVIQAIGDVNPDKFGGFTPGTWIPIVPESEVLKGGFDYYLVLPWHFKDFFLKSPIFDGKTLVFPLPELNVVKR